MRDREKGGGREGERGRMGEGGGGRGIEEGEREGGGEGGQEGQREKEDGEKAGGRREGEGSGTEEGGEGTFGVCVCMYIHTCTQAKYKDELERGGTHPRCKSHQSVHH